MRESRVRFIHQLGFATPTDDLYSALMLQPRLVGVLVALGILTQSSLLFLGLSAALLWGALVPTHNPFDAIYNHAVAYRRTPGARHLTGTSPLRHEHGWRGRAGDWRRAPRRHHDRGCAHRGAAGCCGDGSGLRGFLCRGERVPSPAPTSDGGDLTCFRGHPPLVINRWGTRHQRSLAASYSGAANQSARRD
jgi:hypothetical protein